MGNGWLKPAEFWGLNPREVWWILDQRKPVQMYGDMTESEVKELYDEASGKSPEPAWRLNARKKSRAARRAHRARS